MARIFITGSSDGLGSLAAQQLVRDGHTVVLHARNVQRAADARAAVPEAEAVVLGDLTTLDAMHHVAEQVNALGSFDAVIHNAAMGYKEKHRVETTDGLEAVFTVNSLAPYVLTALIRKPKRLIYVSSELHRRGNATLSDLLWTKRAWHGTQAYSDTKLHNVLLAFGVARRWPDVFSNALEPGWVPTKMGGPRATGDLHEGYRTQVWLATSNDPAAQVTGEYFYHHQLRKPSGATRDIAKQDALLQAYEAFSGVALPA